MQRVKAIAEIEEALRVLDLPTCSEREGTRVVDGKVVAASSAWKVGHIQAKLRAIRGYITHKAPRTRH